MSLRGPAYWLGQEISDAQLDRLCMSSINWDATCYGRVSQTCEVSLEDLYGRDWPIVADTGRGRSQRR
jgi:hypothetical protein